MSQLVDLEKRTAEIKTAVDEFIRRVERWIQFTDGKKEMPSDIDAALDVCHFMCSGPIPEECKHLCMVAIPRMAEEQRKFVTFEEGGFIRDGALVIPAGRWFAAARAIVEARSKSEVPKREVLEPVEELLKNGVKPEQIAQAIYGRRGVGPFITNGITDIKLIRQQAEYERQMRENGETKIVPVITEDWTPPWYQNDEATRKATLRQRLEVYDRLENPPKKGDPAGIDGLLREGAYVQQIEKAMQCSREEVLAVAERIGVEPSDGPGYRRAAQPLDSEDGDRQSSADAEALKSLVLEAFETSGRVKDGSAIGGEMRAAGYQITNTQASAFISHFMKAERKKTPQKDPAA